jgi:hypothetical protein
MRWRAAWRLARELRHNFEDHVEYSWAIEQDVQILGGLLARAWECQGDRDCHDPYAIRGCPLSAQQERRNQALCEIFDPPTYRGVLLEPR